MCTCSCKTNCPMSLAVRTKQLAAATLDTWTHNWLQVQNLRNSFKKIVLFFRLQAVDVQDGYSYIK